MSDDYTYRLVDLVNSDFRMPESDKDFTLSTEQLCKVCKILLYKLNLVSKKNEYERGELASMINEKLVRSSNWPNHLLRKLTLSSILFIMTSKIS